MIDTGYAIAGAVTGFIVGLTGVGGGALMTPILLLVFGVSPTTAIATDLWFAAITKLVGAGIHHRAGTVDWQVVRRLWAGSLPVALLTVVLVSAGNKIGKVAWLADMVGLVVMVTAVGLIIAPWLLKLATTRRIEQPVHFKALQPMLTILAGATLGVCVALTSVGAGALGSVMLLYLYPLRMTSHRLVATDLVHAIPLAMVAGSGYLMVGLVDSAMLTSLLSGSVPAIVLGSLLTRKVPGRFLQLALAAVLLSAGVKILF